MKLPNKGKIGKSSRYLSQIIQNIGFLSEFWCPKFKFPKFKSAKYFVISPILLGGGGQFCPTPKSYSNNFNLGKFTQKCYQILARSYFPNFLQQNQNYQRVTWPPYDVFIDFAINSMVKVQQNQKFCNFVKNNI